MSQERRVHLWPPPKPTIPLPEAGPAQTVRDKIIHALRDIYDPELPINIYDLGLIYRLDLDEPAGQVKIDMTLTTPNCPEADAILNRVRQQIAAIPGIRKVDVRVVWDPPWDKSRMAPEVRLALGLD